ncbi:MAG: helix-turn-helix domain-containing protein [Candidatus Woesearchaeota archaeon]
MDQNILENAGLTRIEAKLYLTILEEGVSLAGNLSRISGIHRRSVYDAMERLIQKGLVSYIKRNNRRYFQATDPKRISDIMKSKSEDINQILPQLMIKFRLSKEKQETNFFKGKEGIRAVFEDQLNTEKDVLVIGGSQKAEEILRYFLPRYTKERIEKKIRLKILFDESIRKDIKDIPLSDIRFLPKGHGGHAAINIYGNNTAIILWTDNPLAILIKNKEIADSYRKYFDLLWKSSKK